MSAEPSLGARARSFAAVAREYEQGRPGYPPAAVAWLLGHEPLLVLDLGAGTGKLTDALLSAGHDVVAVEPLAEMRELLQRRLPSARVLDGSAEAVPLADASVDAVVVGAAFHWFEQDAALAEIARVLRPPGILGLIGNAFDTRASWVRGLREILGPPAIQRPGHWPSHEALSAVFEDVGDGEFPHAQSVELDTLLDLARSRSSVAVLAPSDRERLLARIAQLWREQVAPASGERVELPWLARARRCRVLRANAVARA